MKLSKEELFVFREKALYWAQQFELCMVLNNNFSQNAFGLHDVEFVLAAGARNTLNATCGDAFAALDNFLGSVTGPVFGALSYDLKNEIEDLRSEHHTGIRFPDLIFFEPEHYLVVDNEGHVHGDRRLFETINGFEATDDSGNFAPPTIKQRVARDEYLANVERIRQHIIAGDVYELNYCVEFFAEQVALHPAEMYLRLIAASPTPFSAFFRCGYQYLLCASPERFMKKQGNRLYSQPMKGTIRRGKDAADDSRQKELLLRSEKERAENLMIADLVRNDLAHSAQTGTVRVDELFGIYGFAYVYQMVSTISAEIKEGVSIVDAIRNAFPMGSMTGAPKIMAMKLIEQYEKTKRGLYSGAVGYINPNGDFDLNVVIRSMQWNARTGYLSFEVGSAITFDSDPEAEYEECLLKARAMMQVLGATVSS